MNIRAPSRHGAWVCHPDPAAGPAVMANNLEIFRKYPEKFGSIRRMLRAESGSLGNTVIMTGHQPDWFHPGVWAKNFLVSHVANSCGGSGVHCVIDTDTPKAFSWKIPAPPRDDNPAGAVSIPFMPALNGKVPWELIPSIPVPDLSNALRRAVAVCREWGFEPFATGVLEHLAKAPCFEGISGQMSSMRKFAESGLGVHLIDWLVSDICKLRGFAELVSHLFLENEGAFDNYNSAVEAFRSDHGIHQAGQPVPRLEQVDGWRETPLWAYSDKFPERSRLWIRRDGAVIAWRAGDGEMSGRLPCSDMGELANGVQGLAKSGVRFRTRALMTSLLLRVFGSDLFVHGLGGGLYDEMTDRWIRGWLGIEPPVSFVFSFTARLPIPSPRHTRLELRALKDAVRKIRWHGEKVTCDPASQSCLEILARVKWRLVEWRPPDRPGKRARCHYLRLVNSDIAECHSAGAASPRALLDRSGEWAREEKLVLSREIPWVLHPAEGTGRILKGFLAGISG